MSYAIGVAEPLSIHVDTYGTAKEGTNDKQILAAVKKAFDFRPGGCRTCQCKVVNYCARLSPLVSAVAATCMVQES